MNGRGRPFVAGACVRPKLLEIVCRGRGRVIGARLDQSDEGQDRADNDDETDQIDDTVHASLLSLERELVKQELVPRNRTGSEKSAPRLPVFRCHDEAFELKSGSNRAADQGPCTE